MSWRASGPELVVVGEPEPLGRGGGVRFAAQAREETGALYVLNGDELIDVDLVALADAHSAHGGAATIVVAPLPVSFGVVDSTTRTVCRGSTRRRSSRTG